MTMPSISDVSSGQTITATLYNNTKNAIRNHYNANAVETSGAQAVAGVKTFADVPVFSTGVTITAGGATVTAGNVTVTAGNVVLTAGNLTFGAASAKVIPGATSILFRNNADAATNVTIADAGAVTIHRAGLTVTTGGVTVTGNSTITGTLGGVTTLTANTFAGGAATSKVLIGSSALQVRDSGDTLTLASISTSNLTWGGATGLGSVTVAGASVSLGANTNGFVEVGAPLATSATAQFLCIPSCAGTPSGVPSGMTANMLPFIYDRTNNKIAVYNGAWKQTAALT